jgi:hypothetical protein
VIDASSSSTCHRVKLMPAHTRGSGIGQKANAKIGNAASASHALTTRVGQSHRVPLARWQAGAAAFNEVIAPIRWQRQRACRLPDQAVFGRRSGS